MAKSENRINKTRYDAVLRTRICPECMNYLVVDVVKMTKSDVLDKRAKFAGSYHECGGPKGHKCWHMTKYDPNKERKPLYEVFGVKENE